MVVTNIAIIVIMLMIIQQDIEYHKDEYCYYQCHFFLLCWLSHITGEQELDSGGERRALASQAPKTKRRTERGLGMTNEDSKITIKN